MAANDEFPRGWVVTLLTNNAGSTTVTIPSAPGIAHVIDKIEFAMTNQNATNAYLTGIALTASDASFNQQVGLVGVEEAPTNGLPTGGDTIEGPFLAGVGASVSVAPAATIASQNAIVRVYGHDV